MANEIVDRPRRPLYDKAPARARQCPSCSFHCLPRRWPAPLVVGYYVFN